MLIVYLQHVMLFIFFQAILYRQAEPPQPLKPEPPGGHPLPSLIPPGHPDIRGPPGPPDLRPPHDMRGPPDRRLPPDMRGPPPPDLRGPPLDRREGRGPPDDRGRPMDRYGPRGPPAFDGGEARRNADFRGPPEFRGPGSDF